MPWTVRAVYAGSSVSKWIGSIRRQRRCPQLHWRSSPIRPIHTVALMLSYQSVTEPNRQHTVEAIAILEVRPDIRLASQTLKCLARWMVLSLRTLSGVDGQEYT